MTGTHDASMGELPLPTKAYDLHVLPREAGRIAEDADHGWVFGLPRGITTAQWPLDPGTGAPLMHGFTLLLPPDYRCHGPDIAGLAFFATPFDANDGGGLAHDDPFQRMILRPEAAKDVDPAWAAYHRHALGVHPRTHWMRDILGYHYAAVLLTAAELATPFAEPPALAMRDGGRPEWMTGGAARVHFANYGYREDQIATLAPADALSGHHAVRWTPRAQDPNAGRAPMEDFGERGTASGYVSPYDRERDYALHDWARDHALDHIGGTMRPIQAVPRMSPYHIGFEEPFGGYNFGGGNAQLDFKTMTFDWACG